MRKRAFFIDEDDTDMQKTASPIAFAHGIELKSEYIYSHQRELEKARRFIFSKKMKRLTIAFGFL